MRYLIYLINSLRAPEDRVPEGEFFTRAQFWAVYSGGWAQAHAWCSNTNPRVTWRPGRVAGNVRVLAGWLRRAPRPLGRACQPARPRSPGAGFIVLHGIFNAISVKLLGFLSILSVGFHVIGTLVIVIGASWWWWYFRA